MIRSLKRALVPLIALSASISAWILLAALPAAALSPVSLATDATDSKGMASFPGAETLCDGDCSGLPPFGLPLAQADPFDFELGLRIVEQGLDLTISSGGSVYLVGPANASDSIIFRAAQVLVFETTVNGHDFSIEIDTPGDGKIPLPGLIDVPDLVALPGDRDWPICGCITLSTEIVLAGEGGALEVTASDGPGLRLDGDRLIVAAQAVEGGSASTPPPIGGLWVSRAGDVYVDLSGASLRSLTVDAAGAVVVAGGRAAPVPEPGTALLLGAGLAALASRRVGSRR